MELKRFIEMLNEFAEVLPNKLNTKIKIGNTFGEGNLTFGEVFYRYDNEHLCIINSYYHYQLKYDKNKKEEHEIFLERERIEDFVKENSIKDYAIWRVQNGKPELEYCTGYN